MKCFRRKKSILLTHTATNLVCAVFVQCNDILPVYYVRIFDRSPRFKVSDENKQTNNNKRTLDSGFSQAISIFCSTSYIDVIIAAALVVVVVVVVFFLLISDARVKLSTKLCAFSSVINIICVLVEYNAALPLLFYRCYVMLSTYTIV